MKKGGRLQRKTPLRARPKKREERGPRMASLDWVEKTLGLPMGSPASTVRSTTERTPAPPQPKDGRFECRVVLDFHKRQACASTDELDCMGPIDPHHFPTIGAGGDDLGVIPLCRFHHDQAQKYEGHFTQAWQHRAAADALVEFIRNASAPERMAFFAAWDTYAEGRVFTGIPF